MGVGDQMSLLGGAVLAGGVGMFDAITPALGRVRRQKACMAGSASILWPGELACRSDRCEPGALLWVVEASSEWGGGPALASRPYLGWAPFHICLGLSDPKIAGLLTSA